MTTFLVCLVLVSIWPLSPTGAFPRIGTDLGGSRTRRDVTCRDGLEYPNGNICCLNCPAGTHMKSPCTIAGEKGKCEECDYGTYTEHANGLEHCFKCTLCHSDQEIVKPCTPSQDTECQCKPGGFCAPDQACEVCKKCSRCGKDEVIGRNCTPTTNTECKKIQPSSGSTSANTWVIVTLSLLAAGAIVVVMAVCVCRRHRATDSQRNLPDGPKAGQYSDNCPTEEKKNGETRSLSSLNQTRPLEDEQFPSLVPVNGVESLRKCFGYFEEVDVNYHKRFFRHLGIMDNVIKSKEDLPYEDRIHELLNIWVEKEGREASLNDLLKALLALNQRRTAETVKENAIHSGQYFCEC
ncbi:tumor necrosis factor receptor superfamily member 10A-like isoform X4 [Micropterus salmoides]|uniref:hematopoietic death receptor isoform X4 n=1 Tax=Micropterus salmoides TaxID=27706 RepID=UPI0018ED2F80|nr:hematopoietic death receptor isoform X4 [Micropterus salmoides]XP_038595356.1 tumor necrosis factor receptor superfamily member 10A-like isoform X4 [Micropterus salmoides]